MCEPEAKHTNAEMFLSKANISTGTSLSVLLREIPTGNLLMTERQAHGQASQARDCMYMCSVTQSHESEISINTYYNIPNEIIFDWILRSSWRCNRGIMLIMINGENDQHWIGCMTCGSSPHIFYSTGLVFHKHKYSNKMKVISTSWNSIQIQIQVQIDII